MKTTIEMTKKDLEKILRDVGILTGGNKDLLKIFLQKPKSQGKGHDIYPIISSDRIVIVEDSID